MSMESGPRKRLGVIPVQLCHSLISRAIWRSMSHASMRVMSMMKECSPSKATSTAVGSPLALSAHLRGVPEPLDGKSVPGADLLAQLKRDFAAMRDVKSASSRQDSSERHVLATGFRGKA